ncbi:MAG: D-alanine--D-alanine ligase family protein [Acidimicrobiales bacterium]
MSTYGVVFGGPSPEHDISILTGLLASHALIDAGKPVEAIYWSKSGAFFALDPSLEADAYVQGVPAKAVPVELNASPGGGFTAEARMGRRRAIEIDAIVNCCHGGPGEDGTLQATFDLAGIRYTGPSAPGAALGMDKLAFSAVVQNAGLPSLPKALLNAEVEGPDPGFEGPWIIKPRFGGSSIGIQITDDLASARALLRTSPHLRQGAIIEPFLAEAIDLNIGIRTWPEVQLSPIERPLNKEPGRIYSYAEKYLGGAGLSSAPRELPAEVPAVTADAMMEATRSVISLAGVRGIARLDFLWHEGEIYVNEINTIPGALGWYLWVDPEIPFASLLTDLLEEAKQSPTNLYNTQGADGSALRAAGNIASKLA